jgi:hypothetical protein
MILSNIRFNKRRKDPETITDHSVSADHISGKVGVVFYDKAEGISAGNVRLCMTPEEARKLGNHLLEMASKIISK